MYSVGGNEDIRIHDIEVLFTDVLETRQAHSSTQGEAWGGSVVV